MATREKAPFSLVRATVDDLDELMTICYDCFPPEIRRVLMGCSTPATKDEMTKMINDSKEKCRNNPNDIWVGVKDNATGQWIAGGNWRVFINGYSGGGVGVDEPPSWLDEATREASGRLIGKMDSVRARLMPGPFIHLHICFTHPDYRRRGAGGMLLQWGCDLADTLFIPGYIEASVEGNFLYKTFGFYDLEKLEDPSLGEVGMAMKRDARTKPMLGGKAAPPPS